MKTTTVESLAPGVGMKSVTMLSLCPDNPEEACIPMANANDYQQYADEHHPLHDGN